MCVAGPTPGRESGVFCQRCPTSIQERGSARRIGEGARAKIRSTKGARVAAGMRPRLIRNPCGSGSGSGAAGSQRHGGLHRRWLGVVGCDTAASATRLTWVLKCSTSSDVSPGERALAGWPPSSISRGGSSPPQFSLGMCRRLPSRATVGVAGGGLDLVHVHEGLGRADGQHVALGVPAQLHVAAVAL
eukprot:COSAG04_NODE_5507_length_1591_cov_1.544236_1_plen_187_part_10